MQLEVTHRMGQCVVRHQGCNVCQLGLLGFQKLAARRGVEKQVADSNRRADWHTSRVRTQHGSADDLDQRSCLLGGCATLAGSARLERQPRHRRDRGQRLAAKAERRNRQQIVRTAQLRGGMAFKRQQRVVPHHAVPVVGDADQLAAARLHIDADARGAGVERVFEQLLDHRGRAFDHLTGSDLVRDLVGENVNAAHPSIVEGPWLPLALSGSAAAVRPLLRSTAPSAS